MRGSEDSIIALDVGSGTQDILFWRPGEVMENSVQMVLPSPTRLLADRVRQATLERRAIHLSGFLMGGGPVGWAIRDHASAGLPVTAEPDAALTLHDDLAHIREMGVVIQSSSLEGAITILMGDVQKDALEATLARFGLEPPSIWCVAVQDHGHQPQGSNRAFRFAHWEAFLEAGGDMAQTIYEACPSYLTRMRSVLMQVPQGRVMDTGMAAIHGALCDPWAAARVSGGLVVVNLGNQHTMAALVSENRIWGIFEHHTGALRKDALHLWIDRFRRGNVLHEEVMEDGGHGCAYHPEGIPPLTFEAVAVTGPQRDLAQGLGWTMAAPFGNMMLSGCYGLIRALHFADGVSWP